MDKDKIKQGVQLIIEGIGEDASREGLVETPDRIARMYEEILPDLMRMHQFISVKLFQRRIRI